MKFPYRKQLHACAIPETYKYYFAKDNVREIWDCLESEYGQIQKNNNFKTLEIQCKPFYFRATFGLNPITVIRRNSCQLKDIKSLHRQFRFEEQGKEISH